MNILSKALDHIKMTIPLQVLRVAFQDDLHNWRKAPVSIDEMIMEKVIRPRVLIDANLVGGSQALVSLEGIQPQYGDYYSAVYEIPLEKTNYRHIISVLSVNYLPFVGNFGSRGPMSGVMPNQNSNELTLAANRLMDSQSSVPVTSTANVELIGANTVLIRDQYRMASVYVLRCMIGNEENLNNISPRSYLFFATLCQLAVKSYIYTKMLVTMDQAYLQAGQELGAFKSYVDTLQDAEEMYSTYLRETWSGVAFMNDQLSYDRFIKLQVSPGL